MRRILVLGVFAATVLAIGCDDSTTDPPPLEPTGEIYGQVWHRLFPEQPLEGASLSWGEADTVTNALGEYSFQELELGADSLRLGLEGYLPESRWVEVGEDALIESFTLMPLDTVPPDAPLTFEVESVDGLFLRLSWTAPEDETRTGFALWKSPGDPCFSLLPVDSLSFDDIHIAPLREYNYRLQCRDAYGNLSEALEVTVELNTYPTAAVLERCEGSDFESVPMVWSPNEDEDFAFFRLYRSEGSTADSTDTLLYEGVEPSYLDEDVEPNGAYAYRVYSHDETGLISVSNHARGAAQIYVRYFDEPQQLIALPGGETFLAAGRSTGLLRIIDATGAVIDSVQSGYGLANWRLSFDGQALLGFGFSEPGLERVSLDPLALDGGAILETGLAGDLAELGGDSVALALLNGGMPPLVDIDSWQLLGGLEDLENLASQSVLASDPNTRRLWVAQAGEDPRIFALDLTGSEPELVAELARDAVPFGFQWGLDGSLIVADVVDADPPRVQWLDGDDLSTIDEVVLAANRPDRFLLDPDEQAAWLIHFSTYSVSAYDLDDGQKSAQFNMISMPLEMAVLPTAGLIAVTLSNGRIVFCLHPLP